MRILSYVLIILVVLVGISFAVLNSSGVQVNYYLGQKELPLSLLLALVFGLGCLIGLLVSIWILIKTKMKNYRLQQRLKLAEKEIENLRAIPIQDKH